MLDVMLKRKTRKARLKCSLEIGTRNIPTLDIFQRIERQRHEPLKLGGYKIGCRFVCWCAGK